MPSVDRFQKLCHEPVSIWCRSLSEEDTHLLKTELMKGQQDRHCYEKQISVSGLDDKGLASVESCALGMH